MMEEPNGLEGLEISMHIVSTIHSEEKEEILESNFVS
jgi:hypothetical protein